MLKLATKEEIDRLPSLGSNRRYQDLVNQRIVRGTSVVIRKFIYEALERHAETCGPDAENLKKTWGSRVATSAFLCKLDPLKNIGVAASHVPTVHMGTIGGCSAVAALYGNKGQDSVHVPVDAHYFFPEIPLDSTQAPISVGIYSAVHEHLYRIAHVRQASDPLRKERAPEDERIHKWIGLLHLHSERPTDTRFDQALDAIEETEDNRALLKDLAKKMPGTELLALLMRSRSLEVLRANA